MTLLLILAYAALGAAVCVTLAGMVAVLVGVSLWSDWRDGVRA